jgi:hypothetical protein
MLTGYDPVANQTTSFLRYEKWRDGCLIATELQPFRLQHWSLEEFRHSRPPEATSPRLGPAHLARVALT